MNEYTCRHLEEKPTPLIQVSWKRYCLDCAADRYEQGDLRFGAAAFVLAAREEKKQARLDSTRAREVVKLRPQTEYKSAEAMLATSLGVASRGVGS